MKKLDYEDYEDYQKRLQKQETEAERRDYDKWIWEQERMEISEPFVNRMQRY